MAAKRYTTKAAIVSSSFGDQAATADFVFEECEAPRFSGLLDANGNELWTTQNKEFYGFHRWKER